MRASKVTLLWLQLEHRQTWVGQSLAVIRGRRPLVRRALGFYTQMLRNHGFAVRVEDTAVPNVSRAGNKKNSQHSEIHCIVFL
jgi:hypothetical protein